LLVAFGVFFRPDAVVHAISLTDPATFALGLGSAFVALVCWSEAVFLLLRTAGVPITRAHSFTAYNTGLFARRILPLGNATGTPLLAYAISRIDGVRYDRTLGVVAVADLCNHLVTILLSGVAIAIMVVLGETVPSLDTIVVGVLAGAVALLVVVTILFVRRGLLTRAVLGIARRADRSLGERIPPLRRWTAPGRIEDGLREFYATVDHVGRDRHALVGAFALSAVARVCFALPLYISLHALGAQVPFAVALFAVLAGGVAVFVPLPGGVGSVELALTGLLLVLTGLNAPLVVAAVLLYRVCSYWFLLAVSGLTSTLYGPSVRTLSAGARTRAREVRE